MTRRQAVGAFAGGNHLLHRLLQLDLALDLPRPLLTSTAPHRGDDRHRGEAHPRHACHSIPLPTATPTTRATSWPPTTMPWLSSSCLRRRSRSSRLSDKVGGGLGRVVDRLLRQEIGRAHV